MRNFILLLLCILSSVQPLSTKSLHLFILGDDTNKNIWSSVRQDITNIEQSFSYIASVGNLPFYPVKLTRSHRTLSRSHVISSIRKASIKSDDIVVLYYSGHGQGEPCNFTIWPTGNFRNERQLEDLVDFSEIMRRLFSKKAGSPKHVVLKKFLA